MNVLRRRIHDLKLEAAISFPLLYSKSKNTKQTKCASLLPTAYTTHNLASSLLRLLLRPPAPSPAQPPAPNSFSVKVMKDGLSTLHVPYSYGFAIILLTVVVKIVTLPLIKQHVESTLAMQNLQPKIKEIQERYAGNQERIQLETSRLYKQAGVNPLAGCLPTLATIPVWIGLYQALSNVSNEVRDVMKKHEELPELHVCKEQELLMDQLVEITSKSCGCLLLTDHVPLVYFFAF